MRRPAYGGQSTALFRYTTEEAPLGTIEVTGATYLHQRFTLDYGEDVTAKDSER